MILSVRSLVADHTLQECMHFISKKSNTPTEFSVRVYVGRYGPVTAALLVGIIKQILT